LDIFCYFFYSSFVKFNKSARFGSYKAKIELNEATIPVSYRFLMSQFGFLTEKAKNINIKKK